MFVYASTAGGYTAVTKGLRVLSVNCLLTLTIDSLNLKLANDRVQMRGALPLEALKNGAAPVICRLRRRRGVYPYGNTPAGSGCFRRCTDCLLNSALTFKTQQTSSPQYLSQHISLRTISARNTRSSSVPLLCVPFRRTSFARRSFSTATPLT